MLDYYDRCYDKELERSPARDTVNLEGLSTEDSAGLLLSKGCVTPMICP